MECPVCSKRMVEKNFGGVMVDVCENGCKGMFFDWNELRKLDEKNKGLGEALQEALNYPRSNVNSRAPLTCPECKAVMHAHKSASDKEINVDECYQCGSFFLDSGELREIRDKGMSAAEHEAYSQRLLQDIPEYVRAQLESSKAQDRTEAIRKYTQFIRLSYYIEGK